LSLSIEKTGGKEERYDNNLKRGRFIQGSEKIAGRLARNTTHLHRREEEQLHVEKKGTE